MSPMLSPSPLPITIWEKSPDSALDTTYDESLGETHLITKLTAKLIGLNEAAAFFDVPPFEYEVLIPDFTRRQLQLQVGQTVQLFTIDYIDGNPTQGGRMVPRLIGFTHIIEREFFELFCSVDGVGAKKALRAMVRPVQEVASLIENQDAKALATLPGIGPATAERVIAKLRRKMPKFALLIQEEMGSGESLEPSMVEETHELLVSLGHSDSDARQLIDRTLEQGKKYKDVESLLQAVYQLQRSP